MDIEEARRNMLTQQIRTWHVSDPALIELLNRTPRELFVPERYRHLAFAETAIPLDDGRLMQPPSEQARILDVLKVQKHEVVLQCGVASGYMTAMLAEQAQQVICIDTNQALLDSAQQKLQALNISNVTLTTQQDWQSLAPFHIIVLSGSLPSLPDAFRLALEIGGRLFAVLGFAPSMSATLLTRNTVDEWQSDILYETVRPRLYNQPEPDRFSL